MEENKFEETKKNLEDNNKKTKKKLPVVNIKLAILGVIVLLCGFLTYFLLTGTLFAPKTPSITKQANIDKTNLFGDITNTPPNQNINQNTINTVQFANITEQQDQQQNQQQNQQNIPTNQAQTQITTFDQEKSTKVNKSVTEKEKDNNSIEQSRKVKKVALKYKKQKKEEKEDIFYLPVDEIRADSFVLGGNEYIEGDMLNLHINGQNIKGKISEIQNDKIKIEMVNETDKKKKTGIVEIYESNINKNPDLNWIVR
jgi:hypothetical protein